MYAEDRELLLKVEGFGDESGEFMGVVDGEAAPTETNELKVGK